MSSYVNEIQRACELAKGWASRDGIHAAIDENGKETYLVQQRLKAACHGREDVAALVIIQHSMLRRLDQLRTLAVIGLCLMAYVAVRVS